MNGFCGDSAYTFCVGEVDSEVRELLRVTKESLYLAIDNAVHGKRLGDIGYAVESYAVDHGLDIVEEFVGHGVGTSVHEDPEVPNFGKKGTGPKLKEGMVIAVEPMINLGTADVYLLDDDWTVVTADNKPSAHFEHTVLITKDGYEILTKR